jgi:hypothetical protein
MSTSDSRALSSHDAFRNQQIDLFQYFLCNSTAERNQLSNTFDLWDSVPRYAISRQAMDKARKSKGFLDLKEIPFQWRGQSLCAVIQPARVRIDKNGTTLDYYPSANEELIEDALRKIAAEQDCGFFDKPNHQSGVVFTLYMLRDELKKRGHSRSYQQIMISLEILARSTIAIKTADGDGPMGFDVSPYFPRLSRVSHSRLAEDPNAKWMVRFHPLVTASIDALTYRQFNYAQMMTHKSQLARWLHKQLSLKFTFASLTTSFDIRFSTVKRDSALLEGYKQERQAVAALDSSLNELQASGVLTHIKKNDIRGQRSKLEDVVYTLTASKEFIRHIKAANKRQMMNENQPEKLSTTGSYR